MSEKEIYLEVKGLSKEYSGLRAVDDFSMQVFQGDIYGFLGPNGAGKSTTIRMILSLITPSSGKICLFGEDLSVNRYDTLRRIGALIEKPDFYRYLTARKNLEILGRLSGLKDTRRKIDEVLDLVDLLPRAESKVRTYSQGMRQRLGIAQSILHEPDLVILDEPGNGLDPQGQKEMRELILLLNRERGITFIISSHILAEVEQIANRMVIINRGRKVIEGEVQELLNGEGLRVLFRTGNLLKTREFLDHSEWKDSVVGEKDGGILLSIPRADIPVLTRLFGEAGIDVYGIIPARSLEDYFIQKTSDEYTG